MQKKDIELMRLRTQMSEMYRQAQPPYLPSQQKAAKDVLNKLQENYKILSGEYCEHFLIKEDVQHKELNEGISTDIIMVADTMDFNTNEILKKIWNETNVKEREKLLREMGHSTKYADYPYDDLTGEIKSRIITKKIKFQSGPNKR